MTTPDAISDDDARTLLTAVRDYPFGFTADELPALLEHLGWNVTTERPASSMVATTTWDLPTAKVYITRSGGHVQMLDANLTNRLTPPTDDTAALLQDTFARLTGIATDLFGAPTRTEPGTAPRIRWTLGDTTILITRLTRTVDLIWVATSYQEQEDAREQGEQA